MNRLARLLVLSIFESFAGILLARGVYFFTHESLGYTKRQNLWLALGLGVIYIVGALPSHRLAQRIREKRVLVLAVVGQIAGLSLLYVRPHGATLVVGAMLASFNHGLMWPVIESYVSAGRTPAQTSRALGQFNLAWSGAIPLSVFAAGPIIAWSGRALFPTAIALHVVALALTWPLAAGPVHLAHDHPERLAGEHRPRYGALLVSSRWSLLSSYALMFVLAPLMPQLFQDAQGLNLSVTGATALAGLIDAARWVTFAAMHRTHRWHGRVDLLLVTVAAVPAGFFIVLFGRTLAMVTVGEVLFGVAEGVAYYAALYYAMVVKDASVDAGGVHEGLIGLGYTLGPAAGLAGLALAATLGPVGGMIAGVGPVAAVCAVAGAWTLRRARRAPMTGPR